MYSLIIAGGIGKRFWPRSRRSRPKQLLDIVSAESMLKMTYQRLLEVSDRKRVYVVANPGLRTSIMKDLKGFPKNNYISEPSGKNTAPCIGLAAAIIADKDPDAIMGVFPADHLIRDIKAFKEAVAVGYRIAKDHEALVTFGIPPSRPATGYGYIQFDQKNPVISESVYKVKTFAEKPNLDTARRFLNSGEFLWNSGMFIWNVQTILNAIKLFLPELHTSLKEIVASIDTPRFETVLKREWATISNNSIDYGVMEKAKNVYVVKGNFDWNDVGSWDSIYELKDKDMNNNVLIGNHLALASQGNYIYSEKGLVTTIGVKNLIIIQTKDALLVVNRNESENVKELVDMLEREKQQEYL